MLCVRGSLNLIFAALLQTTISERYLWVDALCIVQDDPGDKHQQIANMDAVYAHGLLTIVNAAGADANAGLPGIQPGSRTAFQPIVEYAHKRHLILTRPPLKTRLTRSPWNTRA